MMIMISSFRLPVKWAILFMSAVGFLLLNGCSTTDVRLNLSASPDLNSNNHNEALPVMVRVYQLADVQTFRNASFDQLWQSDVLILGSDLVDKKELTVKPNAEVDYEFVQVDGANYIAMFVLFRNVEQSNWRWLHKLDGGVLSFDSAFDIQLLNNKIYYLDN